MTEKDLEDIISRYPELIEPNLTLTGRQVYLFGRRIDLLFKDQFGRQLIIELKNGPIKDEHIGQILSYEGTLLSADNPDVRVMLVGTRVPPNIVRVLDHHGIAWKEITYSHLREFVGGKNEPEMLTMLTEIEVLQYQDKTNYTPPRMSKAVETVSTNHPRPVSTGETAGIKIYKGSPATLKNVQATLVKSIDFSRLKIFDNTDLNLMMKKLQAQNEPIYAWAGLALMQKQIRLGDTIYFVLADNYEVYSFNYQDTIFDSQSEFQSFVGWLGKGYERVVFMTGRRYQKLSQHQVDQIIQLTEARYLQGGVPRYIYKPYLFDTQIEKLKGILNEISG